MSMKIGFAACAALAGLAFAAAPAQADDHAYSEGQVMTIEKIRTVDGHLDDYMKWLDTTWKALQEASKKAGYIVSYEVLLASPHGPDDPDVILVTTYKNWAAFDGFLAKGDTVAKQIEGSVAASNQAQADRAKIRRVLGSETVQKAELK
jgi:hypothetical protein